MEDIVASQRRETRGLIQRLYAPRAVAVVGARPDRTSMGGRALWALVDGAYSGQIYPVNPKYQEVANLPCYPSLSAIPDVVDVVEILISATGTMSVLKEASAKGAFAAILLNAGYAEMGQEGAEAQLRMAQLAAEGGVHLVGPNCGGVMNVRDDIKLGFLPSFDLLDYPVGRMGLVSQSGGVLANALNKVHDRKVGLSYAASTGNEAELDWIDFLDFTVHDDGTSAIAVYAESMPDAARFMEVAAEALRLGKPIVLLKGGSSVSGQAAAASHTAALATSQRVLEAVARRYCITLVDDLDDLIDITTYLASERQSRGASMVAVGTSGGMGVLTVDALERRQVPMTVLTDETVGRLSAALPPYAIARNPIDITGNYLNDPGLFKKAIGVLADAPEIGGILFSFGMISEGYAERFADEILEVSQAVKQAVAVCWVGGSLTAGGVGRLREGGIPVFTRHDTIAKALHASGEFARAHAVAEQHELRPRPPQIDQALTVAPEGMTEYDAQTFLAGHGVPIVRGALARSSEEAVSVATQLGYPVVMKVSSSSIRHKSDVGGVRLDLASPEAVDLAFDDLMAIFSTDSASVPEVLVQEMASEGLEMIVGLQREPTFGWLVLVGGGGIYAEAASDVSLSPAPVTTEEAQLMLQELRCYPLLNGVRGRPPYDVAALADLVQRVSELPELFGDQDVELDLNPVLVFENGKGVRCVDALIVPSQADIGATSAAFRDRASDQH